MKKILFIGLLLTIVLVSGCTGPTKPEQPTPTGISSSTIDIKGSAFVPTTITVPSETTVTWTNKDSATHTITGNNFDSGPLSQDQTFSQVFNETGTFDYYCKIHPSMRGRVIVQ